MPGRNNFPKLHNAMWPGLVGKGPDSEPPINLETMLDLTSAAEVDGIKFDSKAEARRYSELMLMMAAGEIGEVVLQPRFVISINGTKICTYVGDFEYHRRGVRVIEDVKGVKTPAYRIKKKLMKAVHGIDIEEIT